MQLLSCPEPSAHYTCGDESDSDLSDEVTNTIYYLLISVCLYHNMNQMFFIRYENNCLSKWNNASDDEDTTLVRK